MVEKRHSINVAEFTHPDSRTACAEQLLPQEFQWIGLPGFCKSPDSHSGHQRLLVQCQYSVRSVQTVSDDDELDLHYEMRTLQHQNPKWKIFSFFD